MTPIRRFSTSRGFWGEGASQPENELLADELERQVLLFSPQQRIASCGARLLVYRVVDQCDRQTGEVTTRYRFDAVIERPVGIVGMEVLDEDWLFKNRIDAALLRHLLAESPRRLAG